MSDRLTLDDLDAAERQPCEIYTRVMGYHRPITEFNPGKQAEVRDRVYFQEARAAPHLS